MAEEKKRAEWTSSERKKKIIDGGKEASWRASKEEYKGIVNRRIIVSFESRFEGGLKKRLQRRMVFSPVRVPCEAFTKPRYTRSAPAYPQRIDAPAQGEKFNKGSARTIDRGSGKKDRGRARRASRLGAVSGRLGARWPSEDGRLMGGGKRCDWEKRWCDIDEKIFNWTHEVQHFVYILEFKVKSLSLSKAKDQISNICYSILFDRTDNKFIFVIKIRYNCTTNYLVSLVPRVESIRG